MSIHNLATIGKSAATARNQSMAGIWTGQQKAPSTWNLHYNSCFEERERERGRYYNVQSISIAHFGSWKVPKFGSPANLLVKLPWKQRVDLAQEMSILHPEAEVLVPGTPLRSSLRSSLGRSSHRDSAPGGWSWGRMKESLKNGIHLSSGGGFRNHPGLEVWNYLEIWSFQESWGCKAADFKNHLRIWAGQGLICK